MGAACFWKWEYCLTFIKHFPSSRHCSKHLIHTSLSSPGNGPQKYMPLLCPLCRCGNWGLEQEAGILSLLLWPVTGGAVTRRLTFCPLGPSTLTLLHSQVLTVLLPLHPAELSADCAMPQSAPLCTKRHFWLSLEHKGQEKKWMRHFLHVLPGPGTLAYAHFHWGLLRLGVMLALCS